MACSPIFAGNSWHVKHMCGSCLAEQPFLVNPKELRFTQADIRSTFTDPSYPSVRETASLIRRGVLDPAILGPLHVSFDYQRRMWCDNNRRLFALREAGVDSITILFDGTRRPTRSFECKLSDPAFMPRIRGEASRVQIPTTLSLPGSVSAASMNRQPYYSHQDEVDEGELVARFTQVNIEVHAHPTHRDLVCSKQYGGVNQDDSVFMPSSRARGSGVQTPPTPSSGPNPYQMKMDTSVEDSVSDGYSKRQMHNSHQCVEEGMLENYVPTIFHEIEDKDEDGVDYQHYDFHDYDYELYW